MTKRSCASRVLTALGLPAPASRGRAGLPGARSDRRNCRDLLLSEQLLRDMGLRREDLLRKDGPRPR
jgi:hypothetical protein